MTAAWWGAMLAGTSLPGSRVPKLPLGDKAVHFLAYLVMAGLFALCLAVQRRFPALAARSSEAALLLLYVYSLLDEVHQLLIPRRSFDWGDWLADVLGATLGVLIVRVFQERPTARTEEPE